MIAITPALTAPVVQPPINPQPPAETTARQPAATAEADFAKPGKSAAAPGQLAKVAVAEARAAGIDLPSNAQGLAASQIARGADPASVFAALTADEHAQPDAPADPDAAVPVPDAPVADAPDTPLTGGTPATDDTAAAELIEQAARDAAEMTQMAAQTYDQSAAALANGASPAEIALDLLS